MKKIILLFAFISWGTSAIQAQNDTTAHKTIPQQDTTGVSDGSSGILGDFLEFVVDKNKKKEKKGWKEELHAGFGFVVGNLENSSANIVHGSSWSIDMGFKTIYRVSGIYALTIDVDFRTTTHKVIGGISNDIIGSTIEVHPGNFVLNNESFVIGGIGLGLGNRFNFCKTSGVGSYVEVSVYGNYAFGQYNISYEGENGTSTTVLYKKSNLFRPFEAGAQVNLGFRWFNVWGRYRFTDCFYSSQTAVKLPRFVVGLGVTL